MARYINADEALRISKEGRFMWAYDLTDLEEFLTNVPSVDAVEVVRCKDCKHFDLYGCWICTMHSLKETEDESGANIYMMPDDFCSYGERKENGDGRA